MKKSLLGGFIGLSIILSIDSLSRVIISLYMKKDILMFSYGAYPGVLWPVLLTGIAAFSTFFGAMFAFTYGRRKPIFTLILFIVLVALFRYGQLLLLNETESQYLFYSIAALILSLASIFLAWKFTRPNKQNTPDDQKEFEPVTPKHHHHPVENDEQHNPLP